MNIPVSKTTMNVNNNHWAKVVVAMMIASSVTTLIIYSYMITSSVTLDTSGKNYNIVVDKPTLSSSSSLALSYDSYQYYDSSKYVPAPFEDYVYRNSELLGLTSKSFCPSGCYLWGYDGNPEGPSDEEKEHLQRVPDDVRKQYLEHVAQMDQYQDFIANKFKLSLPPYLGTGTSKERKYSDLRHALRHYNHSVVCDPLQVPWGGSTMKSTTSLLSHIQHTAASGSQSDIQFVEPLLPQLRHYGLCLDKNRYLMDMKYMVHDFRYICNRLTPHSRTIFVDMGGSLLFHGGTSNPAITIANLYEQFGIMFDHVYAFEMTPFTPDQVKMIYQSNLPKTWETSYHWINVGVDSTVGSKLNPWTMIKEHFLPEDLVVVKLDIDTPTVELPLAQQFLQDPELLGLVDQFYFEYHVKLKELSRNWGYNLDDSVYDALHLMTQLREKGVGAHFWV